MQHTSTPHIKMTARVQHASTPRATCSPPGCRVLSPLARAFSRVVL